MREVRRFVICLVLIPSIATGIACSREDDGGGAKLQFLKSGDAYAVKKDYQAAIVEYRNAIQQDPRFGEARLKLADALASLGDVRNATREYVRAADLIP